MTMTTIITIHQIDEDHLAEVKVEMMALGSPRIHAVWSDALGAWVALEGVHRLGAAAQLGCPVEIIDVEYSDVEMAGFNWSDSTDCTVAELVDGAATRYNAGLYVKVEII